MLEQERHPPRLPRCPSVEHGHRCVLDEGHQMGPHVAANGWDWFPITGRCLLLGIVPDNYGPGRAPLCDRPAGHDGHCVERPNYEPEGAGGAAPEPRQRGPEQRSPGQRGVCQCGAKRQEHEGATKLGGCLVTGCKGYRK